MLEIDPELRAALAVIGGVFPPTITPDLLPFMRRSYASLPREEIIKNYGVEITDFVFPGYRGESIAASVISPKNLGHKNGKVPMPLPTVLVFHSGGMMFGDRFSGLDKILAWVNKFQIRVVTVEYRLAPEHPDPIPVEDCYAALQWVFAEHEKLGVRIERLVVAGASAGAGLAAGVILASLDRDTYLPQGVILDYPMLDDRGLTASNYEFDGVGVWDRVSNETGWKALLGDRYGTDEVSPYAAPARATSLKGFPKTFIDVGTVEIFRDETVDFATRLWKDGVDAELHVWPGAFHACDVFAAHAQISRSMIETRTDWLRRTLLD